MSPALSRPRCPTLLPPPPVGSHNRSMGPGPGLRKAELPADRALRRPKSHEPCPAQLAVGRAVECALCAVKRAWLAAYWHVGETLVDDYLAGRKPIPAYRLEALPLDDRRRVRAELDRLDLTGEGRAA